jgi:putative spermidine/putrescine transport system permease protein
MRKRLTLAGLLAPPLAWLVVAYLGALAAIFATAVWSTDPFTNQVVRTFTTDNLRTLVSDPTYLRIIGRTLLIAASVTLLCALIALPFAFFMAKVAPRRIRGLLIALVLVPLWASYLVKAYAWRTMIGPGGVLDSTIGGTPGYGFTAVVTLTYLWLPYMILPIYAGLERLPDSHLEASADLGAGNWTTFVRIVLPALLPSIAAGTIFTFSLSLGDYIAVQIVGGTLQVLGTAVLQNITLDLPFAAALGTGSVVIMVIYLLAVRRTGALENL